MNEKTKINCVNFLMGLVGLCLMVVSAYATITINKQYILQFILGCLMYYLGIRDYIKC